MKSILITPAQTLIDEEQVTHPETIAVVLSNGHAYDIHQIVELLEAHDKKHARKNGFKLLRRISAFPSALKQAIKEADQSDYSHNQTRD